MPQSQSCTPDAWLLRPVSSVNSRAAVSAQGSCTLAREPVTLCQKSSVSVRRNNSTSKAAVYTTTSTDCGILYSVGMACPTLPCHSARGWHHVAQADVQLAQLLFIHRRW